VLIPTSTTLNYSISNHVVTLTATVQATSGATPAGAIEFMNGTGVMGTEPLNNGVASLSFSQPTGSLSITAVYAANGVDAGSTSTQPLILTF
jgi:hypothetical protein